MKKRKTAIGEVYALVLADRNGVDNDVHRTCYQDLERHVVSMPSALPYHHINIKP